MRLLPNLPVQEATSGGGGAAREQRQRLQAVLQGALDTPRAGDIIQQYRWRMKQDQAQQQQMWEAMRRIHRDS